jgi:glycosyltransferase involved in cell wall biosynthesis
MRVCHIWENFFPVQVGGIEQYILKMSNFLSAHSSLQFIMLTDKSTVSLPKRLALPSCEKFGQLEVYRVGPFIPCLLKNGLFVLTKHRSKFLDETQWQSLLQNALSINKIRKADIFHLHGIWHATYPTIALELSKRFNRPLVVSLHGDSTDTTERNAMPLTDPVILGVLRHAKVITTFSSETKMRLNELGLNHVSLIPNFVNLSYYHQPGSFVKNNDVIMVSRLDEYKDPLPAIRAFAMVKEKVPNVKIEIIGYGPLFEPAKRLVKDLKLEENVIFLGKEIDIKKFLYGSRIYVGTKGGYIGLLEAWAAGLSAIVPNIGIFKELINNKVNGLLVEPGNVKQLSDAIQSLHRDSALQKKLSDNGRLSAKRHNIEIISEQLAGIYYSLT